MSNTQNMVDTEVLKDFVEKKFNGSFIELYTLCQHFLNCNEITRAAFLDCFKGNLYVSPADIKEFNESELHSPNPRSRLMQNLHFNVWKDFLKVMKDHVSPGAHHFFQDGYIYHDLRRNNLGCPNLDGLNRILCEISELDVCYKELESIKNLFNSISQDGFSSKMKLKGALVDCIQLVATMVNVKERILNIVQPRHMKQTEVKSKEEIEFLLNSKIKESCRGEFDLTNRVSVKIFANGNWDFKFYAGSTNRYYEMALN